MLVGRPLRYGSLIAVPALAGCNAAITSVGAWLPEARTGFYLEAESGQLSGGFTIASDPSASAGLCIDPPAGAPSPDQPGSARARYSLEIATPGLYVIWGRIHSPDATHNTFWIQLDAGTWHIWRITTGEVWFWDRFHENFDYGTPLKFDLGTGPHQLLIANSVEGDRLDRMYVTADGDTPSGNDTLCNPPHSVQLDGGCAPSCGSQGGNLCGQVACSGQPILPAYDCDICCIAP
jgi:hypothetical protein